jgi:hypothetical protein
MLREMTGEKIGKRKRLKDKGKRLETGGKRLKRKGPRGVGIRDCRRLTQGFEGAEGKRFKRKGPRSQGVKGSREKD